MALAYLAERFIHRILEFLRHWYIKSGRIYFHFWVEQLEALDYTLAWKITLRHLFEPLFGDYTFLGRLLGFPFRLIRLLVATAIYAVIISFAVALYVAWLLIPPYLFLGVFLG